MPLRLIPDIHRATHRIGLFLEGATDGAITQAEAHLLAHLADDGECTVAELHRALAHKRSTLTSVLDRLEARGFIERHVSADDRRTFVVRLTRPGAAAARRVRASLAALEEDVLATMTKAEVAGARKILTAMSSLAEPRRATARRSRS